MPRFLEVARTLSISEALQRFCKIAMRSIKSGAPKTGMIEACLPKELTHDHKSESNRRTHHAARDSPRRPRLTTSPATHHDARDSPRRPRLTTTPATHHDARDS